MQNMVRVNSSSGNKWKQLSRCLDLTGEPMVFNLYWANLLSCFRFLVYILRIYNETIFISNHKKKNCCLLLNGWRLHCLSIFVWNRGIKLVSIKMSVVCDFWQVVLNKKDKWWNATFHLGHHWLPFEVSIYGGLRKIEGLQITESVINLLSVSILIFLGIFSLKGMLSITTDKIASQIVVFLFLKQNISCGVLIGHVSLRGF